MNPKEVRSLIQVRLQQANETLSDTKILAAQGAKGRSIVNRAYYAAFYGILALLQEENEAPRKHQGALRRFDELFVKTGKFPKSASKEIHFLFDSRMYDDYARLESVSAAEAAETVEMAERFLAQVARYFDQKHNQNPNPETTEGKTQ